MKYLKFTGEVPRLKTDVVTVKNKRTLAVLGQIKWYGAWRQYCFFTRQPIILNDGCMNEISEMCRQMTIQHRQKRAMQPKEEK